MIVQVHGFDWDIYKERLMPAFAQWLIDGDDTTIYEFYKHTRCAQEDEFLPAVLQTSCAWPRAQAFVAQLPHGTHTRHEYHVLCSAEQFTALSDRYVHRHPPQLYQYSEAVDSVWNALVEDYCQSCLAPSYEGKRADREDEEQDDFEEALGRAQGVVIGQHPTTLHLRGWLATISIRAMALFELLACRRRNLPFGNLYHETGSNCIGYLTPAEVSQLAQCLEMIQPPEQVEAEGDYMRFRLQQAEHPKDFRMIDEVLPAHAHVFCQVVHLAAQDGLGLLCTTD